MDDRTSESTPRFAVLFWYYKFPELCLTRLRLLRRFNPKIQVYGLYGGEVDDYAKFEAMLDGLLDDNWQYPQVRDAQWKWKNGDLMLRDWYEARGDSFDWDTLIVIQWDMLVFAPIEKVFGSLKKEQMYLPGLRPMAELENSRWWWVREGTEARETYIQFRRLLSDRYNFQGPYFGCLFLAACFPRTFLEQYTDTPEPELGFLEYKLPAYASVFDIELHDIPSLTVTWPKERSKTKRVVLTVSGYEIENRDIALELLNPVGARLFHPVSRDFPWKGSKIATVVIAELMGAGFRSVASRLRCVAKMVIKRN